MNTGYRRNAADGKQRVVVVMSEREAGDVDRWGIPAGMTSRSAALRFLLRKGLEAVTADENRRPAG